MKLSRSLPLGILAALALPAAASAHPGVFTVTQTYRVASNTTCQWPDTTPGTCLATRTQYAVANDGYALSFTESNGVNGSGLLNYRAMAGTWRNTMSAEDKRAYGPAQTDLQAHATCAGIGLDDSASILGWQTAIPADPFFNYVPWQSTSAGIGDVPAEWIAPVKAETGVDLTGMTAAQAEAACIGKSGVYRAADTSAAITGEQIADATRPLQSQITQLQTGIASLTTAKAAVDAQLAAALAPKPRALTLKLSAKKFDQGVAMVTGEPNTAVTVKALLSSANAKKLKIARTISSKSVKIDATGAALVDLGLTKKAAKAIDKHLPQLKVTVEAAAGTAKQTATGTLTR
ncbi:hypothetical protein OJ998_37145 [Solirubrobacter taibaiensis]|nr:hypothetical protein [Solirubrobacter taibaiensis]